MEQTSGEGEAMSLIEDLEKFQQGTTQGPWEALSDGSIVQTKHITRDLWYIPMNKVDQDFIIYMRNNLPEIIEAIKGKA